MLGVLYFAKSTLTVYGILIVRIHMWHWLQWAVLLGALSIPVYGSSTPPSVDHPLHLSQAHLSDEFDVVIEIPAGTSVKYEVDPDSGHLRVDRFLTMPVVYPTNYGFIPASLAADGDTLDALVVSRQPISPGAVIRVRAVAVLTMTDAGEADDKIIAVPVNSVDPSYASVQTMDDFRPDLTEHIVGFFNVYKRPADGTGTGGIELGGFADASAASAIVRSALAAYQAQATQINQDQ